MSYIKLLRLTLCGAVAPVLLAGCFDFDFMGPGGGFIGAEAGGSPYAFKLSPDGSRILAGDTTTFVTTTCPTGCFLPPRVTSDWTIDGSSILAPSGKTSQVDSLSVRAVTRGVTRVTAVSHSDTLKRQTVTIAVVDSADVNQVLLIGPATFSASAAGTSDFTVSLEIRDAFGRLRAQPTAWVVSDTTLITILPNSNPYLVNTRTVHVKKVGEVDIRAKFLNVEGLLHVSIRQ